MNILRHFLKYNGKTLAYSFLGFFLIWQIYTGVLLLQNETRHIDQQIKQNVEKIEHHVVNKDSQALKNTLWALKGEYTKNLIFIPASEIEMYVKEIGIGEIGQNILFRPHTFKLIFNGTGLGEIKALLDIKGLVVNSFLSNIPLYIIVGMCFFLVLFSSNYQNIKNLQYIYNAFDELKNSSDVGGLKKLQEILESHINDRNSTRLAVQYVSTMREFLKIVKERHEIDKELEMAEEKQKMIKMFAHNVNTPLKTINVLASRVKDRLEANESKLFDMALDRLMGVANRILVKEVEPLNADQDNKTRDIISVIERIVETKKKEYSNFSEIKLEFINQSNKSTLPSNVPVDPLFHVLSNLINNSYEAIDGSGEINVSLEIENNLLIIQITDTGKGIPDEVIDNIWKEGFSYDKRNGNGLGLAHAKQQIVDNWGGKYHCISELGLGTTISFSIPAIIR